MPHQRGFEQFPMPRTGDPVEDDPGDRHLRIVPRKAADQRRHGRALPPRINDQHNRPTGELCQFRRGAGLAIGTGAVEQAHDAFAQHKLGIALQIRDEPGERRAAHRPQIEIDAGPAARGGMKRRIDVVGSRFRGGHPDPAPTQMPQ